MNTPHGGKIINRFIKKRPLVALSKMYRIYPSDIAISDIFNIANGVFSPLEGFATEKEFYNIVNNNKYANLVWTIPIILDIDKKDKNNIKIGDELAICNQKKEIIGIIEAQDIYFHNKNIHAMKVFGTKDINHPGVRNIFEMKEFILAGKISVFGENKCSKTWLTPRQARDIFAQKGFKTIAGFQTRNVIHRAHEYLQRCALELTDGLFLQPIVGWKKKGDFSAKVIIDTYREFIKDYYQKNRVVFGTLKTAMRYAGPKEAVFHAIIRKNFGCTHFIVGRDHAGVGNYYGKYQAHEIFDKIGNIGIEILKFKEPVYCSRCNLIVTEKTCGHNSKYHQEISGTLVRKIIKNGKQPIHQIFRPEVYKLLESKFKHHQLFYI